MANLIKIALIIFGLILIFDQLYLFGIPFGGFLGDLSAYDPTQSPLIHHWMLGVGLVVIGVLLPDRRKR